MNPAEDPGVIPVPCLKLQWRREGGEWQDVPKPTGWKWVDDDPHPVPTWHEVPDGLE